LERCRDVEAVLLQRVVERRRLECPPAVVAVGGLSRVALREELDLVEAARERPERPLPAQVDPREAAGLVLARIVGDILAEAVAVLGAGARLLAEVDGGR